jgi:hypothetical protein
MSGMKLNGLLYVLAATHRHAKDVGVKQFGAHPEKVISVERIDQLRGIRGLKLYVTDTAGSRENYYDLLDMAAERQMIIEYV